MPNDHTLHLNKQEPRAIPEAPSVAGPNLPSPARIPERQANPPGPQKEDEMLKFEPKGKNPTSVPLSAWTISGATVRGLAHHRNGLPCQDSLTWRNTVRPILALSDGAGSAAASEQGAAAMASGISRFLMSLEDALANWLDCTTGEEQEQAEIWSHRLLIHAQGLLDDLAHAERRNVKDLRGTLLLAVVGSIHSFWWQVGDGAVVIQSPSSLRVLGEPNKTKGEFANQTCFVDTARIEDVQFGLLSTSEITGVALMSDGGAEKLVAHDGSRVAPRIGKWFDAVAQHVMSPEKLALAFHEPEMWERTNLDDRSIVLTARTRFEAGETLSPPSYPASSSATSPVPPATE